jgi:hypothetical protein
MDQNLNFQNWCMEILILDWDQIDLKRMVIDNKFQTTEQTMDVYIESI